MGSTAGSVDDFISFEKSGREWIVLRQIVKDSVHVNNFERKKVIKSFVKCKIIIDIRIELTLESIYQPFPVYSF